jgi:hypothetical protein
VLCPVGQRRDDVDNEAELSWVDLNSGLLAAARYDAEIKRLAIRFRKGTVYYYLDVPKEVYDALLAAPSVGAYFVQRIRDEFRFVVLEQ